MSESVGIFPAGSGHVLKSTDDVENDLTAMPESASVSDAVAGMATLLRHSSRANAQAASFTREIRRQSPGVDHSLAATLGSLVPIPDQGRIHDAPAEGVVDAFAVDAPIMHWACTGADSPWRGRIEIVRGNIAPAPWSYAAMADHPSAGRLLMAAWRFGALPEPGPGARTILCRPLGQPPERAALSWKPRDGKEYSRRKDEIGA
ncbi:hypothetical protein FPV16_11840 [Methylobacterium sp. W2]|uniref:hypothetical protein n=1 Tax=Methylobacterium sp. W2 TaxID=2598107 RepID=UPI001D0CB80C|nr:hypothetical protein [Methylobacterium sp. W2]MCC0806912.1 hypothetical protein [Methylobacterium sp. W2]